jgi:cell division septation protein DedD
MLYRLRFIATLVCLSLTLSTFAEEVVFINDDLKTGLNRAAGEGKLVFLEFWASYCTPCKVMEEYTFTNPSVIERMTNHYVPVKVNIQSFDGFDLKNQFKVTVLPTIIILDSKGRQVARYEETMSATKLNTILDKYNVPQNRTRPVATFANNSVGSNPQVSRFTTTAAPAKPVASPPSVAAPAPIRTVPANYNTTPQRKPLAATPNAPEVGQRRDMPTTGFTIQAGAYGQAASAQMAVDEMKTKIGSQKQYILQSKTASGKMTYRILIGNFTSRQQADVFRKKAAIEGYVRGFDEFSKK